MRYFVDDLCDYSFCVMPAPPCYDGMAQLASASRHRQHPNVQDPAFIKDYLSWPNTAAMLMLDGNSLVGFMLLERRSPLDRHLIVGAAFAAEGRNEEVTAASLSCGLYRWLGSQAMQFMSLGAMAKGRRMRRMQLFPEFTKAVIHVPERGYAEDHERLQRLGWRSCGLTSRYGLRLRQFHLCTAYGLDSGQVLAAARQFSLTRS